MNRILSQLLQENFLHNTALYDRISDFLKRREVDRDYLLPWKAATSMNHQFAILDLDLRCTNHIALGAACLATPGGVKRLVKSWTVKGFNLSSTEEKQQDYFGKSLEMCEMIITALSTGK
jgi:hypothetical protein